VKIGFNWTLDLFAVGAFFWLIEEIRYWQAHAPSMRLEKTGILELFPLHRPCAGDLRTDQMAEVDHWHFRLLGNAAVHFRSLAAELCILPLR